MIKRIRCVLKIYSILFIQVSFSEEYNLFGIPGQGYIVKATLGHPPQKLNLLVDTGSSDITVASRDHSDITTYFHAANSTSFKDYGHEVQAKYTTGDLKAWLGNDFVQFPSLSMVEVRSDVALITEAHNFFMNGAGWQGLLGLAYPAVSARGANDPILWLSAVDEARGRDVMFSLKLCGVREPDNATHYGSFRLLEDVSENTNHNPSFKTPILRKRWFEIGTLSVRIISPSGRQNVTSTSPLLVVKDDRGEAKQAVDAKPNDIICRKLNEQYSILDSGTTNIRLPENVFTKVVDDIRNAARATNNQFIILNDLFWYHGEAACWPEPRAWSLPWLAIDLLSAEDDRQYFTIELPPQNYMRLVSARRGGDGGGGDGSVPELCYKFGVERGTPTVLGVAAIEGAQVTFNRASGHITFQTSDCGPAIRITGPHNFSHPILEYCKLPATHDPIQPIAIAQWVVAGALAIAMTLLIYLLAPCVRTRCMRVRRVPMQISLSTAALVVESESTMSAN